MAVPNISLNLVEKILIVFDGNKSKLHEFCENCDKAIELVQAETRPLIFTIIQTKITGNAGALRG